MNIQSIIMVFVLFAIFEFIKDKVLKYIEDTKALITLQKDNIISEQAKVINQQKELNTNLKMSTVNFDETKKVLMSMIDEYISFVFRNEIDMPHNIRNKEKPTSWEGVYVIPSSELQQKHYDDLKTIVREHMSESFMDRLRVFYKDSYISKYIDQYIYTEYNRRLRITMETAREFRDLCNKNIREYQKEMEEAEKKSRFNKHEKINRLLKVFGFQEVLPTNDDQAEKATPLEEIDTMKLYKHRYLLNKRYYDSLAKNVKDTDDVLVDYDKLKYGPDDKFVTFMSKEYNWNKLSTKPEEIEKYKLEIAEVCMKHGLNPIQIGLFGEHDKAGPYQYEDETGAIVSMTKHRLNPIFYTEEFYAKGFHSIAEAIHEEGFEIFI